MNARLALKLRVAQETRGHTRVAVFVGDDHDHLALSGHLTLRQEEWALLRGRLGRLADTNLLVVIEPDSGPHLTPAQAIQVAIAHVEHPDPVPGCALCGASLAEIR